MLYYANSIQVTKQPLIIIIITKLFPNIVVIPFDKNCIIVLVYRVTRKSLRE
jgi:hypothetical protein